MPFRSALHFVETFVILLIVAIGAQRVVAATWSLACPESCADVTPDGAADTVNGGWSGALSYTVTNTGTAKLTTFEFTTNHGASLGGVEVDSVVPASATMKRDAITTVNVYVNPAGAGMVALRAVVQGEETPVDSGYRNITVRPVVTIAAPQLTSDTTALVYSRMPLLQVRIFPASAFLDSTRFVVTLGADTITSLVRRSFGLIEWEVDSARQLSPGVLKKLSVRACMLNNGPCTTATRYLRLDDSGKPFVSFQSMPFEALGRQAGAVLGPGIAASGPEIEASIRVPAYVSLGVARSAGLVYSTRQSHPRALVNADIELTWPAGTPNQIRALLRDGNTPLDSVVLSSPTCSAAVGRRCRIGLQADFASTSFGRATRKWLRLDVTVTSGATSKTTTDSVEVVLTDRRTSPYGSGWWVSGIMRLDSAGTDMVLVDPSGAVTIFRGHGGRFLAPPGDYSMLSWVGSQWELRPRGGGPNAKIVFSAAGRMTSVVDRNGNETRVAYASGSERVDTIIDPTNRRFRFYYSGSPARLDSIVDAAGRRSRFTIDASNQLVYDSTASPPARRAAGRFAYSSSGANFAIVLSTRVGAADDTTQVTYSGRWRPTQVTLPRVLPETGSTLVVPVVGYEAQETRALGTLISADSGYRKITDPHGHWRRTALTRWGAPTRTWDAIGDVSFASYTPEGYAVWTRARHDSTRIYSTYDTLGRLVRTFRRRSTSDTVRLDSVVYNSSHWVSKRFGPLGLQDSTRYTYDTRGNVTVVTGPLNQSSYTWYNSLGLVDSVRGVGDTLATRYTYDLSWRNLTKVRDADTTTVLENQLDAVGRVEISVRRLPSRFRNDTLILRWARERTWFASDNLPDSSRAEQSLDCRQPDGCGTSWAEASWPGGLADSLNYARTAYFRDRLGRDTLVTDKYGRGARTEFDALGRALVHVPFRDSSGIVDSMRYDLAGNLRFHRTRRAQVIEHRYDSRGRDTLMIVPGVGEYWRTFGGQNDELTRDSLRGYVDSIGGVRPSLRWAYSPSGLLLSDTAQEARVTTYAYDRLGRDSVITDVTGATSVRYQGTLGYVDRVVTPFADTLNYTLDSKNRLTILNLGAPGATFTRQSYTSDGGRLTTLANQYLPKAGNYAPASQDFGYVAGGALGSRWLERQGAAGATTVARDSFDMDGFDRIVRARYYSGDTTGVSLMRTDSFAFDGRGNVRPSGETRVYDAITNRLMVHDGDSLSYDRAGNLVAHKVAGGSTWTYGYDGLDRLVSVRYGGTLIARYGYDVLGRRIARRVYSAGPNGAALEDVRLIYRGAQVVAEADAAGSLQMAFTWDRGADNLVALRRYSDTLHLHVVQDALHSVRGVVVRSTKAWQASWSYTAWGTPFDSAGSTGMTMRYRWAGQRFDPETGFYHMRARYYDPHSQRFTQDDPSNAVGDYGYAGGNPASRRDPSGLRWEYEVADLASLRPERMAVPWSGLDPLRYAQSIESSFWGMSSYTRLQYREYRTNAQLFLRSLPTRIRADLQDARPMEYQEYVNVMLIGMSRVTNGVIENQVSYYIQSGHLFLGDAYVRSHGRAEAFATTSEYGYTVMEVWLANDRTALLEGRTANYLVHEYLHSVGVMHSSRPNNCTLADAWTTFAYGEAGCPEPNQ